MSTNQKVLMITVVKEGRGKWKEKTGKREVIKGMSR
jgi:hypothetical protein